MKDKMDRDKLDAFFKKEGPFQNALLRLREIMLSHDLNENYKWQMPIYSFEGKNLFGMGAFKHHFGIWFVQGALLKDEGGKLINAQEGKTMAMRQWRFNKEEEIEDELINDYVLEAIENQKAGREIKNAKPIKKAPELTGLIKTALDSNPNLGGAFHQLTPGRQREYIEYIEEAKRETTRASRLEKIKPMILSGMGLNDKYK